MRYIYKEQLKNIIYKSVDALESIALGHQEFNQPETRLQLQRSNKPKNWNLFFVALPSPNTKKNHPKSDLGKDFFFPILYRKINIKIRAFTKTSRKRFWSCRAMDWRLRDVNVGLQGGKCSAQASTHPLLQGQCGFFCLLTAFFCVVLWEFWLRLNEIHGVRPGQHLFPSAKLTLTD